MAATHFSGPVVSAGGFTGDITGAVSATTVAATGVISGGNGTVALPEFTFTSDPDTGIYRIGANNLGVSAAGAKVLDVSATGLTVVGTALTGDGTVALPAHGFSSDTDTGIYRIGANNLGIAANGAKVVDIATTGVAVTGTLSSTGNLTTSTYLQQSAANGLTAAGTTRADALALTNAINRITTATASTGVVLPAASTVGVGGEVIVFNAGASAIKVYAPGSDTIDGTAGSTGVTLTNALRCRYVVLAAGVWISSQLGAVSA